MEVKEKVRVTLDGEKVYENNHKGYRLIYFNGKYGIIRNVLGTQSRIIDESGFCLGKPTPTKIRYAGDNYFIYEDYLTRGIIEDGIVTFQNNTNKIINYYGNNIFYLYLGRDLGSILFDKFGNTICSKVNMNNCIVSNDKIIYEETDSNNLILADKDSNVLYIKKINFKFKIVLFNNDFCVLNIIDGRFNNGYVKYIYSLDMFESLDIINISCLKNNKYLIENMESGYKIVDNNLNDISLIVDKKENEESLIEDNFVKIYENYLVEESQNGIYIIKKIIDDKELYGLAKLGIGVCIKPIFSSITLSDGYVIVNGRYAFPSNRLDDIKIEYLIDIIDGEKVYSLSFDSKEKQITAKNEVLDEMDRLKREYNDKTLTLKENYQKSIEVLKENLNFNTEEVVKRLVLKNRNEN